MARQLYYQKAKKDVGGKMKTHGTYRNNYPEGAIVHFTAGAPNAVSTVKGGIKNRYCFFTIAPDGTVYQNAPLNRWGSHAGRSEHQKLGKSVSRYLVGIEVCCAGELEKTSKGTYKTWFEKTIPASQVRTGPRKQNCIAGHFHKYSAKQEKALVDLILWLKSNNSRVFDFEFVLGHDEVSPGRKTDPGWSLSMTMPDFRAHLRNMAGEKLLDVPAIPAEAKISLRYGPRTFSPDVEAFQKAASGYPGVELVADGYAGKKSSDAFHLLTGFYLKGDSRAKDTPDLDGPKNTAPKKTPPGTRRLKICHEIVKWEGRLDSSGNLKVYKLPSNDGGGSYEVAGINVRYHPDAAKKLKNMIAAGKHKDARNYAAEYLAKYTDLVTKWVQSAGHEAYLRDTAFNRGPTGAAKVLQLALGVTVDGKVGKKTLAAVKKIGSADPIGFLKLLRDARETYERKFIGYRSNFWQGLVNRWNKAHVFALSLHRSSEASAAKAQAELSMSNEADLVTDDAKDAAVPAEPDLLSHPLLSYAPGRYSVVVEKFQEFANTISDFDLEEDGLAGPGTSDAFLALTGYKLARYS